MHQIVPMFALAALAAAAAVPGSRLAPAMGEERAEEGKALFDALTASQHTLAAAIQEVAAKSPEAVISAKFELRDGKLSLSVRAAEKGLAVPAGQNVFKAWSGSPLEAQWNPGAEVFTDVPRVSRSSEQLTLVAISPLSLLDVLGKAWKDQAGIVFSITPAVSNRRPIFEVLVATGTEVVKLTYDLMTGERRNGEKR